MTSAALSVRLEFLELALKNHLWQSTLFALGAAMLTLTLRKNHARTRYWVMFAASLKFLIPFWPLVSLGGLLAVSHRSGAQQRSVSLVMDEISQPFMQTTVQHLGGITPSSPHPSLLLNLSLLIAAVWVLGCFVIVFMWLVSWRRVRIILREAIPVTQMRELKILREVERNCGISTEIQMVFSSSAFGPAVYGIHPPVLIWPSNISSLLDDSQLWAILTHELCMSVVAII